MGDHEPRKTEPGSGARTNPTPQAGRQLPHPIALVVVLALVVGLISLLVPRTVAQGGETGREWELTLTPGVPGLLAASARLETPDGRVTGVRLGSGDGLAAAELFLTPGGGETLLVGPVPDGVNSIRVTSLERGVGEATIGRVGWRKFHLEVLPGDPKLVQVVGIGPAGEVVEVVDDVPAPIESAPGA